MKRFADSEGVVIRFDQSQLCQDCNTPAVVINSRNEIVRLCHDQSCPTSGTPGISDKLHARIYGKEVA
jgi:hypothetical protein